MPKKLDKKLHPHETRILLSLKKMERGLTGDISKDTGLPEATVHKAGQWARLKGLVEHEESVKKRAELTDEGKRYAAEGLPERRLILTISRGESDLNKLKKSFPGLDIGLAWAKRRGWIRITGNTLKLTSLGRNALKTTTPIDNPLTT